MCSVKFPGRVLFIFVYGGVRMVGQIQTQKYGLTENLVPAKIWGSCISPTQKYE